MSRRVPAAELRRWARYFDARDDGLGWERAADRARVPRSTAYRFERGDQGSSGHLAAEILGRTTVGGQPVNKPLGPEATRALTDFAYFRRRYLGRVSMPWQERAAEVILEQMADTAHRSWMVINAPPGSGKSTLFTHDIPCWLIVRNRRVRIMMGSYSERLAKFYVDRLRGTLEREIPVEADPDLVEIGQAFDAQACLLDDYTAFQPEGRSMAWRAEQFVVRQLDGTRPDDKEPTCSAWGKDSGFIGGRFQVVIWDDLADPKNMRSPAVREDLFDWYDSLGESRLEPGGTMIVQGQRINHDDLYRHCLDRKRLDGSPKYGHVMFPAHDDEHCQGHEGDAVTRPEPWPAGCLLDPFRLPHDELADREADNKRLYDTWYQQRDGAVTGGLIEEVWVTGGIDSDGYDAPGCLDRKRAFGQVPEHLLEGAGWSFVTTDPSPGEYWGVQWWVFDPASGNRYLIEGYRKRLGTHEYLGYDMDRIDVNVSAYYGLLEDIRRRSNTAGAPLQYVIFEQNGAQRWFLQQPHVQRWMSPQGVNIPIVGHTTTINKADTKYGLKSIADLFRQGLIRLPWADPVARKYVADLTREGYAYVDGTDDTTDQLMATWFAKLGVERHWNPYGGRDGFFTRGGYLQEARRGLVAYR